MKACYIILLTITILISNVFSIKLKNQISSLNTNTNTLNENTNQIEEEADLFAQLLNEANIENRSDEQNQQPTNNFVQITLESAQSDEDIFGDNLIQASAEVDEAEEYTFGQ